MIGRHEVPRRRRVEPGRTPRSRSIVAAHAVEFSKTAEASRKGFLRGEPMRPCALRRAAGQPRSIALARPQAAKTAPADLQHLAVGAGGGNVVLARGKLAVAERHSPLIDQPPRLRAGD